jgi:hypothetical protein
LFGNRGHVDGELAERNRQVVVVANSNKGGLNFPAVFFVVIGAFPIGVNDDHQIQRTGGGIVKLDFKESEIRRITLKKISENIL